MNSAELKKVNPGDKFAPKAPDWNEFINAALAHRGTLSDQTSGRLLRTSQNGIVPVQNDTTADQDQFAVVILDTLLITPTDNEDEFRHRPPVFSGIAVASGNISRPFAILQEPLKTGLIGKATVAGVTPVKITISDESHGFAELAATGLQSASSGIVRILWKESGTGSKWAIIHFPAGGASSPYDGMFAVVKKTETSVTMQGYVSGTRNWYNYVIIGLERVTVAQADITSITTSRWVYLQTYYSAGWYCALTSAAALPAQTESSMFHPIAWIDCASNKISKITQIQYGPIVYNRRLV